MIGSRNICREADATGDGRRQPEGMRRPIAIMTVALSVMATAVPAVAGPAGLPWRDCDDGLLCAELAVPAD